MSNFYHDLVRDYKLERVEIGGKRHYLTPEGNHYPSVTTVLSTLNKDAIERWRKSVGEEQANKVSTQASRRGTAVHNILERYVLNEENIFRGEMPANIATAKLVQPYLDEHCGVVRGIETTLYSDKLRTAGQCDLIAEIDGVLSIVDYKTAKKAKKEEWVQNYFMQCTTYALMLYERTGLKASQFVVLIATDEDGLQVFKKSIAEYVPKVRELFRGYNADG